MTSASKNRLAQERAREREVYSYFPPLGNVPDLTSSLEDAPDVFPPHAHLPHASLDPVLTAFAQLGALRLDASRALISLVDSQSQIVLAESTKTLSLRSHLSGNAESDLRLGVAKFPRAYGLCDRVFETPQQPAVVINDLELDHAYASRPFVQSPPDFRFYAAVPLRSLTGAVIGVYSVLDHAPRDGLDRPQLLFMQEMAATVVSYLSASRAHESNRKAEQMVRGLTSFVTGAADLKASVELDVLRLPPDAPLSSPLPTRESVHSTQSSSSDGRQSPVEDDEINALQNDILPPGAKQMFSRAANIIRESCNLDGVVFFDASIANNVSHGESPPPSGTDDSDTEPSEFVESSTGNSSESNRSASSSDAQAATCRILGFADPSRSSRDDNQPRKAYLGLTEQSLRRLLARNPHGKIFNVSRLNADLAPRKRTKKGRSMRSTAVEAIVDVAHNARSAAIIPLWDFERERWFAGCLCWVSTPGRLLSYGSDLLFLRAFGQSIMSELSRIESIAVNDAKTTFIKSISHELRSPLHGILGGVEFLQNMSLDAAQADTLNSVAMCGHTLLDTVQNILAYSKINELTGPLSNNVPSGHMRLRSSSIDHTGSNPPTNVCQLTEETAEAIFAGQSYNMMTASFDWDELESPSLESPTAVRKPVRVILELPADPCWTFRVRPGIWRRIVMNLFGNALKYTDTGFVRIRLAAEDVSETYSKVMLTVIDSGVGMSARFVADGLFKPFCQENSFSPGTGLGMSIVRRLVESLGGDISVDSHVGVGTEVKVSVNLPRSTPPIDNAVVSAVAGNTTLGRVSVVRETSALADEDQSLAHASEQYFHDSLLSTLQGWFGTTASTPDDVSSDSSQLIIYPGPSFSSMFRERSRTGVSVVVALDAIEAATLRADSRIQSHGIEVITQPCGPIKLASILQRYLSRLDPQSNAPLRPDVTVPLPPHASDDDAPTPIPHALASPPPDDDDHPTTQRDPSSLSPLPPPTSAPSPLSPPPAESKPQQLQQHRRHPSKPTSSSSSPSSSPITRPTTTAGAGGKEVMIVDDNPLNLRLLSAFLNKSGIAHASAFNGQEALQMFKDAPKRWAAVLMDLSMPVMDGVTATREIKAWERKLAGGEGPGGRLGELRRDGSDESTHTVKEWRLRSAAVVAAAAVVTGDGSQEEEEEGDDDDDGGSASSAAAGALPDPEHEQEEQAGGLASPPDDPPPPPAAKGAEDEEEDEEKQQQQQTVRSVPGGVQIIVITGLGSAAARFEAMAAGADEFMTKPIKFEALTKKLKERIAS